MKYHYSKTTQGLIEQLNQIRETYRGLEPERYIRMSGLLARQLLKKDDVISVAWSMSASVYEFLIPEDKDSAKINGIKIGSIHNVKGQHDLRMTVDVGENIHEIVIFTLEDILSKGAKA